MVGNVLVRSLRIALPACTQMLAIPIPVNVNVFLKIWGVLGYYGLSFLERGDPDNAQGLGIRLSKNNGYIAQVMEAGDGNMLISIQVLRAVTNNLQRRMCWAEVDLGWCTNGSLKMGRRLQSREWKLRL